MSITTTAPASPSAHRLRVASRVAAAVLGGYAFAWGLVALTTSLLFAAELDFHDAEFTGAVVGLLGYLVVFLWAIAARRLALVWPVLLIGGAAMVGAASLVQSMLV
ncbi:iron uptake protein [Lysobacter arvi]|uniref:Iron uptake protein n=1 Tax=Lysobacter arvi TaxID=3038776 RepID=A0ABU1CA45_9GAMM|nr:iron uptake protein [Lysobacter arvi]MDR0182061.1 iron uptake protein [Lysobacter arvi]